MGHSEFDGLFPDASKVDCWTQPRGTKDAFERKWRAVTGRESKAFLHIK
jgi:hypothetical protein